MTEYFKKLPFYEPKIKRLKNINLLSKLPFYEESNVIKTNLSFTGYATSYKVELVVKKDPLIQLEANKSGIKDLLNVFLDEAKGFKYQITLKVNLKKYKEETEFNSTHFNSTTKT